MKKIITTTAALMLAAAANGQGFTPMPKEAVSASASHTNGVIIVSAEHPTTVGERGWSLFDDNINTKWLAYDNKGWIVYQFADGDRWAVTNYVLSTANDSGERDPNEWRLEGSNNLNGNDKTAVENATWEEVHYYNKTPRGQLAGRHETVSFSCEANVVPYNAYRLNILANAGASDRIQLAEWEMQGHSGLRLTETEPDFDGNPEIAVDGADFTITAALSNGEFDLLLLLGDGVEYASTNVLETAAEAPLSGTWVIPSHELDPDTMYAAALLATNEWGEAAFAAAPDAFYTGAIWLEWTLDADESGFVPGIATVFREDTPEATRLALVVKYAFVDNSNAVVNVNYAPAASGMVVIPAGAGSAQIFVTPLFDANSAGDTVMAVELATGSYFINALSNSVPVTIKKLDFDPNYKTWIGTNGNDASDPLNWAPAGVPASTDKIMLGLFSSEDLEWDYDGGLNGLPDTVAEWRQDEGYKGTVTFATTRDGAFPVFTITGGAVFMDGVWTHPAGGATGAHWLSVAVGGDMVFGSGALVDLRDRGYSPGNGPGYSWVSSSPNYCGAAMAGEAFTRFLEQPHRGPTYGLVRTPSEPGSSSGQRSGAGAAWLEVGGHLELDGTINANGTGWRDGGASSGGAVYVKAASLSGAGTITANGGEDGANGSASGGRIAIIGVGFTVPGELVCRAFGGLTQEGGDTWVCAGAGTIFYGANDMEGVVVVDNNNATKPQRNPFAYTHLPARRVADQGEDLSQTFWWVTRNGTVSLQAPAFIASMALDAGTSLNLNGRVLTLDAFEVNGTVYPKGVYTSADFGNEVTGGGFVNVGAFSIVTNSVPWMDGADAVCNGDVVATNGPTRLLLYYGPTDGGTNPAAWTNEVVLTTSASAGPASHTVNAPAGGQLFYRYAVSNEVGITWAPESSVLFLIAVNVAATAHADKAAGAVGQFKITRPVGEDTSLPVSVNFTLSDSAQNGVDYVLVQSPVEIPIGRDHAFVDITPMGRWNTNPLAVVLTIGIGTYKIGAPGTATVNFAPCVPPQGYNTFLGGDAADPASWTGGMPVDTDNILLSGWALDSNIAWDSPAFPQSVASWTQGAAYKGVVTFGTTYGGDTIDTFVGGAFPVFTINGNAVLEGGTWTHLNHASTPNNTAVYRLNVRVNGGMLFGANALIDLRQRGFRPWEGPCFPPRGDWGGGSAMAGEASGGYDYNEQRNDKTYGLVRTPFLIGTGTQEERGVGAVWLEVAGHLALDGTIMANGTFHSNNGHGGTSGGAVYVKAGTMSGEGLVTANGESHGNGNGSGGRIALVSGSPLPGDLTVQAFGRDGARNYLTGAGTIFYGGPDGVRGTVLVDNPPSGNRLLPTHLPAAYPADQDEHLRLTDWVASRSGVVKLAADVQINSFTLDNSPARLNLNGHTLTLYTFYGRNGVRFARPGVYTENPPSGAFDNVDFNGGAVKITSAATLLMVR